MLSKKNNKETNTKIAVCYRFFLLLAVIFVLGNFLILPAQAQFVENLDGTSALDGSAGLDAIEGDINLQSTDIRTFIARIINIALGFIGIIMLVLIM